MRKRLFAVLTIVLLTIMLAGCQTPSPVKIEDEKETEAVDIRIGGLKGPTSMGMVRLMELAEAGEVANNYTFTISGSADEVTPKLIKGELDMAAVPANLASVLYNNTNGEVKLLAINTLGVNYIVNKGDEVQSFADLKGKTIYGTGKGSIPEYILRYLLSANGIDPDKDVKLEWKSEPTEIVALFSKLEKGIALMPQPYVTVAQTQIEGLRIALDLTKEWRALSNDSTLITGVLVVRKDFAEKYPEQIATFLDEYQQSTEYVNAHIPEAAKLVEKYGIVKAAVAEKAIPYCNIYYMDGTEMKTAMQGYLKVLYEQNPKAIGGKLPRDDFYYEKE
ncbi:MAG: ABC transporter substrate-binding protein [Clostridia bacterium]|jgi:NitT/TauT family transport system substrate-binding protein|nr:ABC transporter substrate-binding protein [Clostridia bacterium]